MRLAFLILALVAAVVAIPAQPSPTVTKPFESPLIVQCLPGSYTCGTAPGHSCKLCAIWICNGAGDWQINNICGDQNGSCKMMNSAVYCMNRRVAMLPEISRAEPTELPTSASHDVKQARSAAPVPHKTEHPEMITTHGTEDAVDLESQFCSAGQQKCGMNLFHNGRPLCVDCVAMECILGFWHPIKSCALASGSCRLRDNRASCIRDSHPPHQGSAEDQQDESGGNVLEEHEQSGIVPRGESAETGDSLKNACRPGELMCGNIFSAKGINCIHCTISFCDGMGQWQVRTRCAHHTESCAVRNGTPVCLYYQADSDPDKDDAAEGQVAVVPSKVQERSNDNGIQTSDGDKCVPGFRRCGSIEAGLLSGMNCQSCIVEVCTASGDWRVDEYCNSRRGSCSWRRGNAYCRWNLYGTPLPTSPVKKAVDPDSQEVQDSPKGSDGTQGNIEHNKGALSAPIESQKESVGQASQCNFGDRMCSGRFGYCEKCIIVICNASGYWQPANYCAEHDNSCIDPSIHFPSSYCVGRMSGSKLPEISDSTQVLGARGEEAVATLTTAVATKKAPNPVPAGCSPGTYFCGHNYQTTCLWCAIWVCDGTGTPVPAAYCRNESYSCVEQAGGVPHCV